MANYVKFLRGTPTAYNNLATKEPDTLYFIYEESEDSGQLYLGSRLIAGGDGDSSSTGVTLLSQLKDVVLTELGTDSFLVYNGTSWVNKDLDDLVMVGANSSGSTGISGLVPAPGAYENTLFLRGDGTWAAPQVDHTVLTIENTNNNTHQDLINEQASANSISGDIIIIKDPISTGKWQYTAYVYDDGNWSAMDGNYNAENVYFGQDLITTTAIGNIVLTNGQATIETTGKNLKEVFDMIFVEEKNPTITNPEVTLVFSQAKGYEVGTVVSPTYSATMSAGEYEYGPATGLSATSWSIIDTEGNTASTSSGTLSDVTIIDGIQYKITATASHGNGTIPLTNLKKEYTAGQILEGTVSAISGAMYGYRNGFYGTLEEKSELTSDIIRGLSKSNAAMYDGKTTKVNIPLNALRVVFAYPATLGELASVTDTNGLNAEILDGFYHMTLNIEGNNNYDAISYNVYYLDYANPNDKANIYNFKI